MYYRFHLNPSLGLACSLFALLSLGGGSSLGDDSRGHGKSIHGEAFDEGPRQAALLLGEAQVGRVSFPVSSTNTEAQAFFQQGVAQLHAFAFFEAERSFRQALKLDPACAMAHWGMAVANRHNAKRARELIAKAVAAKPSADTRECRWIDAYSGYFAEKPDEPARRRALVKALESLVMDAPEDAEAKVWLALHLWENSSHGIPIESFAAVDALLRDVLSVAPMHPGAHHLRIHLWNYQNDKYALSSAAVCGQSGPGAAHLWHMPGHTFSRLQRFADAAWQQEASARTDHSWMHLRRLMPDQIHNYAHNNDWLVETLGFIGQTQKAVSLAKNMIELPRLAPKTEVIGRTKTVDENSSNAMGVKRLVELLLTFELWDQALQMADTPYLGKQTDPVSEAGRLRLLAAAYFAKGNLEQGAEKLGSLQSSLDQAARERVEAADDAEAKALAAGKSGADLSKAALEVLQQRKAGVERCRSLLAEGRLFEALAKNTPPDAEFFLKGATELHGSRKALLLHALGRAEEAEKLARETSEKEPGRLFPAAVLAEILWKRDKSDEAKKAFQKVREASAGADSSLPILDRLTPLALAAGFQNDGRPPHSTPADSGLRPPLDSLGPFHWSPEPAPKWNLPIENGQKLSLESFKGGPVLVVFYLGSGCLHCIEQLNAFAPFTQKFSASNIPIVAVSTDAPSDLGRTMEKAKSQGGFPFPIVADPELNTFKAYGAYDDFESQPLHGIFLLDAGQRVRWQDISFRPFDKPEWLLEEARRLLQF